MSNLKGRSTPTISLRRVKAGDSARVDGRALVGRRGALVESREPGSRNIHSTCGVTDRENQPEKTALLGGLCEYHMQFGPYEQVLPNTHQHASEPISDPVGLAAALYHDVVGVLTCMPT